MRFLLIAVGGFVAGALLGLIASEAIGIIGFVTFGKAVGVKYLLLYLGAVCAVLLAVADRARRRG